MFFRMINHKLFGPKNDQCPTCAIHDKKINDILDNENTKIEFETHTMIIDGMKIWISNYPYSFGYDYSTSRLERKLPTIATRKRLKKLVDEHKESL